MASNQGSASEYPCKWINQNPDSGCKTPAGVVKGQLTISANGQACFAYEDDGYASPACYQTRKTDKGFRFDGEFDSVFVSTKVVTGIQSCKKQDLIG